MALYFTAIPIVQVRRFNEEAGVNQSVEKCFENNVLIAYSH